MTPETTISHHIQAYGWHCLSVFASSQEEDPFSYSIGFWATYGAPEVLVFGLTDEQAHGLLSECAARLKQGGSIVPDSEDAGILAGGYRVAFKAVRDECFPEYLGTAMRHYQDKPFPAVVMFLPDRQHRFPWHADYAGPSAREALAIV